MKKFNILLAGFAVLALAASCSNEEPAGPVVDPVGDGTSTVLKVKIKGEAGSRANSDKTEGAYDFGTLDEQAVSTANFFFFDADGIYVAQADLWTGTGEDDPEGQTNIDFKSENLLVLKGLTEKKAPKYLVTVLNGGNEIASKMIPGVSTLTQFREEITKDWNYTTTQKDGKDLLVMSTTSHAGQGDDWGCTILSDDNIQVLNKEESAITKEDVDGLTPVDVYVERLAAKYTFASGKPMKVTLTLAGADNEQVGDLPVAAEEVYVTITGFGIVNTPDKSYLMKHLVTPEGWADWNNDADHRSFWGKSYYYDNTDATGLQLTSVAKVMANSDFAPIYSNENTKPYTALQLATAENRVNATLVTNVVFTATVTKDAAGKEALDLVSYNDIYYKQEQFIKYVLNRMKNTSGQAYSGLNYYKKVVESTTETVDGITTTTGETYVQVGPEDFHKVRVTDGAAEFTYELNDGVVLYEYNNNPEDKQFTQIADAATTINTQIRKMFAQNPNVSNANDNYPVAYTGGATYYTIPVEHLVASENKVVTGDGQFGIVRNHWYNFSVTKIMSLGEGVFDPGTVETPGDVITPDPDPQKDKYAMTCRVNILSWKIVQQDIEI